MTTTINGVLSLTLSAEEKPGLVQPANGGTTGIMRAMGPFS